MTSPPQSIHVTCSACGHGFEDWWRPSLNFALEHFDEEYVRQASTATCPECGHVTALGVLTVEAMSLGDDD